MRKISTLIIIAALLLTACAQEQQRGEQSARTVESSGNVADVTIENFAFNPPMITIKAGDSVRWTNKDSVKHTAEGQGFKTALLAQGESETVSFNKPGTYTYKCGPHPTTKGKVIVE